MTEEAPPRYEIARFFTFDDKDREWRERARCRTLDIPVAERVALFFPVRGSSQKEAKACCSQCPVKAECDAYAEVSHSFYGIWAGKARQRYVPTSEPAEALMVLEMRDPMTLVMMSHFPIVLVFGEDQDD